MSVDAVALEGRRAAIEALYATGASSEIAELLASAARASSTNDAGGGSSGQLRAGYNQALVILKHLFRWDASVQTAAEDADRHMAAARRNAELTRARLDGDTPAHDALRDWLSRAEQLDEATEIEGLRAELRRVALPVPTVPKPPAQARRSEKPDDDSGRPRAFCLLQIGGQPLSGPILVHPGTAYDLVVEARVLDWPEWAARIHVRFLSRWQGVAADVPEVILESPSEDHEGVWRGVAAGGVVVRATPAEPDKPLLFTVEVELVGEGRRETIEVLGYAELALYAYDPARDYITGSEVIDQRVHEVLVDIGGSGALQGEREAFAKLFKTLANEAQVLVANRHFRAGERVREADFQARLLERAQSVLGAANVRTGAEVGGGEMDIVYLDTLTAELKVESATPATLENAAKYLGQPVQYASGAGRQLSILCILDVTERSAPVGVLANGIGVLRPMLAGLENPDYPALVGVIIVSAGLPLPSDWAGQRVAIDGAEVGD